ncbi:plasmid mobilization protein [Aristaeella lactis]|uniref:Uncharacterized protein n=1 Tax=Aristaeella lactis TaxID=3046383 RepID=A0AC61PLL4_9FIRM|nr:hypothetical protein [Aristaeella lactis]QUA54648.1 hypothetical protein JYE50_15455 [Aristaeella lactis]SMC63993.1 hypothetical protein SAMN06297397_1709 [Aristaeella lactis]
MSDRVLDRQGRWRSRTVAFRISPEEDAALNERVRLSGLTKQDYIIKRVLEKNIVVMGNPRVHKALSEKMTEILQRLKDLPEDRKPIEPEFWESIQVVANTLAGLSKTMGQMNDM